MDLETAVSKCAIRVGNQNEVPDFTQGTSSAQSLHLGPKQNGLFVPGSLHKDLDRWGWGGHSKEWNSGSLALQTMFFLWPY